MPPRRVRVPTIDLFSGAGLLSAGFQARGFESMLALDVDPDSVRSYNANIAPVAEVDSVERVRNVRCRALLSAPPCQGFSTLGHRDSKDERNALCLHVPEWARAVRPEVVVVENVPPFLNSPQWRRMIRSLESLGFEYVSWVLDAADFGAAQHRQRAFTIASKIGLPRSPRQSRPRPVDFVFDRVSYSDPMHLWPEPSSLALRRFKRIPQGGDWRDVFRRAPHDCPPSWRSLGTHATDIWGRVKLGQPSNTLKSRFQNPSLGRYIHPYEHRVISLREGARVQGIPDSWILYGMREAVVRQIGNGVPLQLGTAIAEVVMELFE
jgi:DNA (cytosine-5)-methyltransferase 1